MKRMVYLLMVLGSLLGKSYSETPSNIKRTQINVEQGDVDLHRASINLNLAAGKSSSNPGLFKEGEVKFSTRFILVGDVKHDKAFGLTLSPDLVTKLRLDETGAKQRLELGGKIISIFDNQHLFYKTRDLEDINEFYDMKSAHTRYLESAMSEITTIKNELLKNNKQDKEKKELERRLKVLTDYAQFLREKLKNGEKISETAVPYATADISMINLGAKYHEVKDASYQFVGFSGSMASASFDLMSKSKDGKIKLGICGIAELLSLKMGMLTSMESGGVGEKRLLYGINGSVCLKFAVGPVVFSNTFSAGAEAGSDATSESARAYKPRFANINNNARLGVKTGIIPGVITELGAFHNYSKEWYPGVDIDSHMVGGGITVLAK